MTIINRETTHSDESKEKLSNERMLNVTNDSNSVSSHSKDLTLRDISFAYPTRPNDLICKNFNLDIPAGQTIALVGASGSGKVSLIV